MIREKVGTFESKYDFEHCETKQDESVTTIAIVVQDMVFLSGLSPGAAERQGICQAGG